MKSPIPYIVLYCVLPLALLAQNTSTAPTSQNLPAQAAPSTQMSSVEQNKGYLINFTNVSLLEYIRFVGRISNQNFLFQEAELIPYNVTIVSEEPTSLEDIMATLLQVLRMYGFTLVEQGNEVLITRNPDVNRIGQIVTNQNPGGQGPIITRVIALTYISPEKAKSLIQPLLSSQALVQAVPETNHLILTDLNANVEKVQTLLKSIDSPNSSIEIAYFIPQNTASSAIQPIAQNILAPIAADTNTKFTIVEQPATNTIFIISSADLIHRALELLQTLDRPGYGLDAAGGSVAVVTYNARYASPTALIPLAERILSPIAASENVPFTMVQQASTRLIFITSTPSFNKRALEVLNVLDQPEVIADTAFGHDLPSSSMENTNFYVYKLQYQNGRDIKEQLHSIGSNGSGDSGGIAQVVFNADLLATVQNAVWIQSTNSLLFFGPETALAKIRALMPQIDIMCRQVYIEVLVIETSLANSLDFGVQWGFQATSSNGFNVSTGLFAPPTLVPNGTAVLNTFLPQFQTPPTVGTTTSPDLPMGAGFNLGSVGKFITHGGRLFGSIGALLTALQAEVNTKVIMNPKIIAQDNSTAKVFIGQNIPYTTTNVSIQAANTSTGFTLDYRDVGVSLQVTPTLGMSDMVNLQLEQLITFVSSTQTINGYPVPTTAKLETTTQVNVPDGYFLVISGMIRNERIYAKSGIPCLGWMPCIGAAFSEQVNHNTKTNTIIFLHPRLIDTPSRMSCITDQEGTEFNWNSRPETCWPYHPPNNPYFKDFSPVCPNGGPQGCEPPCYTFH